MAISKILYMKDCGNHFHGKHLKQSLDYVMNPEKTQNGRLVGGMNCQLDTAFKQMMDTKKDFGKVDKRQGYHLIISFKEGEVSPDTAYEITGRFVKEYLGQQYEAVYCVHDNTDHVHSHIIFNSVSFVDGRKYRYEKGIFNPLPTVYVKSTDFPRLTLAGIRRKNGTIIRNTTITGTEGSYGVR